MPHRARFFTRQGAANLLSEIVGVSVRQSDYGFRPLSARQIRTLAQNGIVRPLYRPAGDAAALDSSLYGLEEVALLYLWVKLGAADVPYVLRALTLERVADAVRAAVRRPGAADGYVVFDYQNGGRVTHERVPGTDVSVPLASLVRDVLKAAASVDTVWNGHAEVKHSEVAEQLACA